MADALEKRNKQAKEWAQRCADLEEQLRLAQEAIDQQDLALRQKDDANAKLTQIIDQMRKEQNKLKIDQSEEAERLQNEIDDQHKKFLETLNQLNQAKAPGKQSFELQNQLLMKKDAECNDLRIQLQDALDGKKEAEDALEAAEEQVQKLSHERDAFRRLNEELMEALREAKSGREEAEEIEKLKLQVNTEQQKVLALRRQKKNLRRAADEIRRQFAEKDSIIEQQQAQVRAYEDKLVECDGRIRNLHNKIDDQKKTISKVLRNEKMLMDKAAAATKRAEDLEKEIRVLESEKQRMIEEKNENAASRIKKLEAHGMNKDKIKDMQIRVRQEMEKRLDAEEAVFNLKEQLTEVKKENAVLQEKVIDAQGADIEPLVELLKDLRVEAVAVDGDLLRLIDEIPESRDLEIPEIPPGICESAAVLIAHVVAQFHDIQIENRELRILIEKLVRTASIYHKISTVVAKYPILSADDIATQEDRGNWVLPIETEHLQRTIVKLHDILIRRKQ